jgi:endonuclease/exonuclease/phosphatase family metal-dependent hydrolase
MIHQLPLRRLSLSLCLVFLNGCGDTGSSNDPLPLTPVERPNGGTRVERPTLKQTPPAQLPSTENLKTPVSPSPHASGNNPIKLSAVPRFGSDATFEIATWNIENYPKSNQSKDQVSRLLQQLDIDLIAMEEIRDETALRDLASAVPGYASILSTEKSEKKTSQNVGFLYKTSVMEIVDSQALFANEDSFPRQPLMVRFKMKNGSADLIAIAVHLKAFEGELNQKLREGANVQLEKFVSDLIRKDPKARVVIMGDFNDRVDLEENRFVFNPWLLKTDVYSFLTEPLALRGDYSFVSSTFTSSVIDHIIASNNLPLEEPEIPKLETLVPNYEGVVSDHLPVMTRLR